MCKKIFAGLLCMILLSGMLAGCVSSSTPPEAAPEGTGAPEPATSENESEDKQELTLTVASSQNWVKDIDRELAAAYTERTGVSFDFQVNPDDQYDNIIKTKLATNEAPDIIYIKVGIALVTYQPEKYFMDLSDMDFVSKMKDWALDGCSLNGSLYAYNTWSTDGNGLLYNKQIFDELNLAAPQTFEELKEVCQVLLDNDIQPIYDNAKDVWHCAWWPNQMAAEMELEIPGFLGKLNTGEIQFADFECMVQMFTDYKELYDLGYLGRNALANEWVPGYEIMGTGQAGMIQTYTTYQNEIAEQFPESQAETWEMFPMLVGDCTTTAFSAGGIARAVNAATPYRDEINDFFSYLAEEENAKAFYTARTDLGTPAFADISVRPMTRGFDSLTEYSINGSATVLSDSVLFWSDSAVGKAMQDMLVGTLSPAEAVKAIDNERAKSLEAAGQ